MGKEEETSAVEERGKDGNPWEKAEEGEEW